MARWLLEIIVSSVLIVLSLIFYYLAEDFGSATNPLDVGPSAFPRLMLAFVAVLCVIQIFLSLRTRKKLLQSGKEAKKLVINNSVAMVCTCVAMVLYALLIPVVGFYIVTPLLIFLVMLLMGNRKWKQLVLTPVCFTLFTYVAFSLVLGISLP